jgi:hypothetical protein
MFQKLISYFFIIVIIAAGISISSGCSRSDEQQKKAEEEKVSQEKQREKIRERLKEQLRKEQSARSSKLRPVEDKAAKQNRATAEFCMQQFQRCTDKCSGSKCEDKCLNYLSVCEKDIPVEFQTLKKD